MNNSVSWGLHEWGFLLTKKPNSTKTLPVITHKIQMIRGHSQQENPQKLIVNWDVPPKFQGIVGSDCMQKPFGFTNSAGCTSSHPSVFRPSSTFVFFSFLLRTDVVSWLIFSLPLLYARTPLTLLCPAALSWPHLPSVSWMKSLARSFAR